MKAPNYFKWPGQIWFFSDPHFNHENILKYERTEFKTIEEHNKIIIKNINTAISPFDTLVCLGDIGTEWKEQFDKIKPSVRKILILGNHDKENKINYRLYFDEVYDGPLFINKFIIASHEPIPVSEHFINIHGHLHDSYLEDEGINHINVSSKMHKYKPLSLSDAYELITNKPRIRARFLDEWYADKYVFTKQRFDCYTYCDTGHIIPQNIIKKAIENARFKLITTTNNEFVEFSKFYDQTKFLPVKEPISILSSDSNETIRDKLIDYYEKNKNKKEINKNE